MGTIRCGYATIAQLKRGLAMVGKTHWIALFGLGLLAPGAPARASAPDPLEWSLEELMSVVVTSVSKKSQTLAETAAAVHVISAEEIRRSGASTIPEALRLAPGVQVAAIGNNKWAVSIRGFADRFSNKMLVLVDGRSVYTPLFSGVLWEALDIPLERIARIEVIRGPGASIWGANAVNGVINILTRSAFDSQGGQVAVATGSELRGHGFASHGWRLDADTAVSLHAKASDVDAARRLTGGEGVDDWQSGTAGFKLERLRENGTWLVQGGVTRTRAGDEVALTRAPPASTGVTVTEKVANTYLMARWEQQSGPAREDSLQFSLEHSDFQHVVLTEHRITADLEYQQRVLLDARQELIWGLAYRYSGDRIDDSAMIQVGERERDTASYSAYAQDEITLEPGRWRLSLGARLEHNDYTGFGFQPNLRLLWTPDAQHSGWLSLARANRTPSRIERGGSAYIQADPAGVPPSVVQLVSGALDEERVTALDLGWRHQFNATASLDLAAFYNRYDNLRGAAYTAPRLILPAGYLLIQTDPNNANRADTYGLEASLDWRPKPDWRLQANYSWLRYGVHTASLPGQSPSDYAGVSPSHQFSLRSSLDITPTLRWDAWLRHVGEVERFGVDAYADLDMRLAWQPRKDLEVSLVGQHLLDRAHPEYGSYFILSTPSEIERGYYVKVDWKF